MKRESLELTETEWEALQDLAAKVNSTATRGPSTGKLSWRRFIKELANGKFLITRIEK